MPITSVVQNSGNKNLTTVVKLDMAITTAKNYRQYKLKSGEMERICWLDNPKLKVGQKLTLKKDYMDRLWEVVQAYDMLEELPPWRTWRVGGLK